MIALLALASVATPPLVDGSCAADAGGSLVVQIAGETVLVGPASVALVDAAPAATPSPDPVTEYSGARADGVAVRLRLGESWVVVLGDAATELSLPRTVRDPSAATVLGVTPTTLWIAAPGLVASVVSTGAAAGALEVTRLAAARDPPRLLHLGEEVLVAAGAAVWRCGRGAGCAPVADLPGPAVAVVVGPDDWWLAVAGRRGALLRGTVAEPERVELILRGEVVALCPAAALVRSPEGDRIVSRNLRDNRFEQIDPLVVLGSALIAARRWPEPALVVAALAAARAGPAAHLEALVMRCTTAGAAEVRAAAAAVLPELHLPTATAARWLLAHDQSETVRAAAADATLAACPSPPDERCLSFLAVHSLDVSPDIAWPARDALLAVDVAAALFRADADYKIDLLERITAQTDHGGPILTDTLMLLRRDSDSHVRALTEAVIRRRLP